MKLNLTIVITIYNNIKYLDRCLTSILNQSVLPDEIIIIDDGSKNKVTITSFKKHKIKFKKIFLYRQKHSGPSTARNLGLKKSSCNFITFFDVDDEMLRDYIKTKKGLLKKISLESTIGVHSFFFRQNEKIYFTNDSNKLTNVDLIGYYKFGISAILNNYILVKRNVKRLNGFDKKLFINEDFDFFIRAIRHNFKIITSNKYDVRVNLTKNSLTRNKNIDFIHSQQKKFLIKAKKMGYFSKKEQLTREQNLEIATLKNYIKEKTNILKILNQAIKILKIATFNKFR